MQPIPSLCFFLRTLRLPLPSLAQATLLFWAQSDIFCSHNPSITHLLFTLHCLPPLLQPISGPACQLSPCCQRITASDSINCFCKPSAAAVVSIPPAASVPSVLFPSSLSDVKTKSGSKFLIYQDALQLVTPTVRPGSCSSGRDGVSDRMVMFALRDVWGLKSSFVWISGQIRANKVFKSVPGNEGEATLVAVNKPWWFWPRL